MDDTFRQISVEVYLPSSVLRGKLITKHQRLSDYLNLKMSDEAIKLEEVEIQTGKVETSSVKPSNALINRRQVTVVVELSPGPSTTGEKEAISPVEKESWSVLIEAGSLWVQGDLHLLPGAELNSFALGNSSFISLTQATFVDSPGSEPRTFMINREKVNCLMPLKKVLPRIADPGPQKQEYAENANPSQSSRRSFRSFKEL